MSGHGWVTPLPGGQVARCGGPGMCKKCREERRALLEPAPEHLVLTWSYERTAITVNGFPPQTMFSVELLEGADPRFLAYDGERVTIKAANGERTYQLEPPTERFLDRGLPTLRLGRLVEVDDAAHGA